MNNQELIKDNIAARKECKREISALSTNGWLDRLINLSHKLPAGYVVMALTPKGTWSLTCPVSLTSNACVKEKVEDNLTLEKLINVGDLPRTMLHIMSWKMERYIGDNRLTQLRHAKTGVLING